MIILCYFYHFHHCLANLIRYVFFLRSAMLLTLQARIFPEIYLGGNFAAFFEQPCCHLVWLDTVRETFV